MADMEYKAQPRPTFTRRTPNNTMFSRPFAAADAADDGGATLSRDRASAARAIPVHTAAYLRHRPTSNTKLRHRVAAPTDRQFFVRDAGDQDLAVANHRPRLDNTQIYVSKRFVGNYPFSDMMIMDIVMMLFYASLIVVSAGTLTGVFDIVSTSYLVAGSTIQAFVSVLLQLPRALSYWWQREKWGFTHLTLLATTVSVYINIPIMLVAWFVIGQWAWEHVDSDHFFEFDAAQPVSGDNESVATYKGVHAIMVCLATIALLIAAFAVFSHNHAQVELTAADHLYHISEDDARKQADDDDDDEGEMDDEDGDEF